MNELAIYLRATRIKQRAFAEQVGTSPATISRLAKGTMKPSLELAHLIERTTKGKVKTESWL